MSDCPLHQSTPGFHGDKCRLRYGEAGGVTYFDLTDGAEREVATVYLPGSQKVSLREACAAFNRIMDEAEGDDINDAEMYRDDPETDSNRTLGLVTIQGGGRGWGT